MDGGGAMSLDAAFVTYLSEGTMEPSRLHRTPQIQIIVGSIATSETPLPEGLSLVREMPTQAPIVRRDIKSNTKAVVNQLRSAGILQVSEEAEAMVSKLMADNLPKATTSRLLKPRTK
jgi:hypothetical protein